jgi:alpha-L-fucosidase 2
MRYTKNWFFNFSIGSGIWRCMASRLFLVCVLLLSSADASARDSKGTAADTVEKYNVVWDTPAETSADSMPLGNGDIGLNVWVERSGDLLFYISKSDAWAESNPGYYALLKLGRVRVKLSPTPFGAEHKFTQTLRLKEGDILVQAADGSMVHIWVDANRPVISVNVQTAHQTTAEVRLESWRTEAIPEVNADTIFPTKNGRIAWCYHNRNQKVAGLKDLTFGAIIKAPGLQNDSATVLRSASTKTEYSVVVYPLTARVSDTVSWLKQAEKNVTKLEPDSPALAYQRHLDWWRKFWDRSYIFVDGNESARQVSQSYALQRFVSACAGRGAYPIKFNGSLFTMDFSFRRRVNDTIQMTPVDADFRRWGGQYWFQNTRAMYWPMLEAGDFDMMQPLFRMYFDLLPDNARQVREYYGHGGAYFDECSPFWGGLNRHRPDDPPNYTAHYYESILELTAMMLDYYAYTDDNTFARQQLLPTADYGLTFYDQHFGRDSSGKLLLEPVNALETFWKVRNPMPDVAGLTAVLDGLLALPAELAGSERRERWHRMRREIPELPQGTVDGKNVLLPFVFAKDPQRRNSENPELYALYPYRLFGMGKPGLDIARATFEARAIKKTGCWSQDPVDAALLGDAEAARQDVIVNFTAKDPKMRFPVFWTSSNDYAPDEDNGGNAMLALEYMLLQADGRHILLLPAWPKDWNAEFRLHAPHNTVVEGVVRNGSLVKWTVSPASRRADVVAP